MKVTSLANLKCAGIHLVRLRKIMKQLAKAADYRTKYEVRMLTIVLTAAEL
jgi:hypothetical protein